MRTVTAAPASAPPDRRPARPSRLRRSWDRNWYAWAMVLPVVIVLAVLIFYPLGRGIWLSFTNLNEANQVAEICTKSITGGEVCEENPNRWEYAGLDNYVRVLTGQVGRFWEWTGITLIWTSVGVAFHYGLGLGLAVLLNRPIRGRGLYRVLLVLPWAVPAFVSAFAWKFIFNERFGLANSVLTGLGADPLPWFSERWTSLFTAIVTNVWLGVPFMMVALLGGLQTIPGELYEAAEIDGASPWQRFRAITLPGLRSTSMTVILLGTIWTFNLFPVIFLVTEGEPAGETEILVTGAYRAAFEGIRNYSLASTYGVLILSILLVFSVFYRRALRKQGEVW
ncbi:carbohydrate ABC transporter permease [Salinispora vitiensis]|uniref:carbohydrate ABC transporter permease n=1 Tax=Salinispora vitiensis TaxID=999544 RepID=UPI0003706C3D|nr:sugar ABC transporter permease [Salinispora vitiensis]